VAGAKETEDGLELAPDPGFVRVAVDRLSGLTEPRLRILDGEDEWELSFSQRSYQLIANGRPQDLSVESVDNKRVTTITAFNSGVLHVVFDDGRMLTVEPALEYEAWELRNSGEPMMFALPLGGSVGFASFL
jgi:Family of unknown function (DUF6188)